MTTNIYVDGSGGTKSGYGFFVKETGESFFEEKPGITNNQAEYLAIISALKKYENSNDEIIIYRVYLIIHNILRPNEKIRF